MNRPAYWTFGMVGVLVVIGIGASTGLAERRPPDVIPVGAFSQMAPSRSLPKGWEEVSLATAYEETTYDLARVDGTVVVRARSNGGTAGIRTERRVDLSTHPILDWRWKVDSIVEDGKAGTKARSDFPARIFVAFDYDDASLDARLKQLAFRALGFDAVPNRALVYVWANRVALDSLFSSVHASWTKMLVVQSGRERTGAWVPERRNVRADYRRAFGEEAPPVEWIGLMTDTNNTQGRVTAYYGDIMFRRAVGNAAREDTGSGAEGEKTSSVTVQQQRSRR